VPDPLSCCIGRGSQDVGLPVTPLRRLKSRSRRKSDDWKSLLVHFWRAWSKSPAVVRFGRTAVRVVPVVLLVLALLASLSRGGALAILLAAAAGRFAIARSFSAGLNLREIPEAVARRTSDPAVWEKLIRRNGDLAEYAAFPEARGLLHREKEVRELENTLHLQKVWSEAAPLPLWVAAELR